MGLFQREQVAAQERLGHDTFAMTSPPEAETGIEIACGDGRTLRILELQPQNGKRMAVASYLAGHPVQVTV